MLENSYNRQLKKKHLKGMNSPAGPLPFFLAAAAATNILMKKTNDQNQWGDPSVPRYCKFH